MSLFMKPRSGGFDQPVTSNHVCPPRPGYDTVLQPVNQKAPQDISSSIDEGNILSHKRRAHLAMADDDLDFHVQCFASGAQFFDQTLEAPKSYSKAMEASDSASWKEAIDAKLSAMDRSWSGIQADCYKIWVASQKPRSKTSVAQMYTHLGVRDVINKTIVDCKYDVLAKGDSATAAELEFLKEFSISNLGLEDTPAVFNPFFQLSGFDGCQDTPIEILHVFLLGVVKYLVRAFMKGLSAAQLQDVMAKYRLFDVGALNIPSIQPQYLTKHYANFIGKDFKIVLQAAPFVFFEYMTDDKRDVWSALCQLAPLVFQTHIDDMETYSAELEVHIRSFMFYLIKRTAQWVNKPKFHGLLHLPEFCRRFGTASSFATEKFKGYNGVLRNSSIHSNRQSPGKDIGVTFANYRNLRHLFSGGSSKPGAVSAEEAFTHKSQLPQGQK
ncbi:hypothetical protein PCASD_22815 [Puccinia coronata f. sp. avenae]|uniref:Uncharacterized protein n=1 Tax=Puccinia coronata f. sp. avenae TaxID=200324 RepID=A0A2N5S375_9BASI|nr:hypothetical protein PCASD_22815 [Puccinia coronata f. sp. avenae]